MKKERDCQNPTFLLETNEVVLSRDEYDASKSKVKVGAKVHKSTNIWKSFEDEPTEVDRIWI